MSPIESTEQVKPKNYGVEISALFVIQLEHFFSDAEIQSSGGLITDAFENLISEIEDYFSSLSIVITFDSAKRRRNDGLYKFSGSLQRCYKFIESDIDESELIDGVFESQLSDMRLAVEEACGMSGYDLSIIHFAWADDEVIDEM